MGTQILHVYMKVKDHFHKLCRPCVPRFRGSLFLDTGKEVFLNVFIIDVLNEQELFEQTFVPRGQETKYEICSQYISS